MLSLFVTSKVSAAQTAVLQGFGITDLSAILLSLVGIQLHIFPCICHRLQRDGHGPYEQCLME